MSMWTLYCNACGAAFRSNDRQRRYCTFACGNRDGMGGPALRLECWRWWEDADTVAWRENIVAWIDAQRADAEKRFHCGACGSDVPLSDLVERRRIA